MSVKRTKSRVPMAWAITIEDPKGNANRYVIQDYDAFIDSGLIARRVAISLGGTITSVQTAGVQDEKLRRYVTGLEKAGDEMTLWFPFSSTHRATRVAEWTAARNSKP